MTPEKALKAYKYVRKFGKKWTPMQVGQFFVEVVRLARRAPTTPAGQEDA